MYESCLDKQRRVIALFSDCDSLDAKYNRLIELGEQNSPFPTSDKTEENLVKGCQSKLYLKTEFCDGQMIFTAVSDALISAGLARVLTLAYSGESPEAVLKCPPTFLEELSLPSLLSPNRTSGLYSLHLRMKQEALKVFFTREQAL